MPIDPPRGPVARKSRSQSAADADLRSALEEVARELDRIRNDLAAQRDAVNAALATIEHRR